MPGSKIVTSDVYQWIPGRFAVLDAAYGRIGDLDVGSVEILGLHATGANHPFELVGMDRTRLRHGRVCENYVVFDLAQFQELVGAETASGDRSAHG